MRSPDTHSSRSSTRAPFHKDPTSAPIQRLPHAPRSERPSPPRCKKWASPCAHFPPQVARSPPFRSHGNAPANLPSPPLPKFSLTSPLENILPLWENSPNPKSQELPPSPNAHSECPSRSTPHLPPRKNPPSPLFPTLLEASHARADMLPPCPIAQDSEVPKPGPRSPKTTRLYAPGYRSPHRQTQPHPEPHRSPPNPESSKQPFACSKLSSNSDSPPSSSCCRSGVSPNFD